MNAGRTARTGSTHEEGASLRFVATSLLLLALGYGAFYFPWPEDGALAQLATSYLRLQAALAGLLIQLGDPTASVAGTQIYGLFPLLVAKNCSSLEVQTLYVAAVAAYPARARRKLVGAAVGVLLLTGLNVLRIAALYFVGSRYPRSFDAVHEEWLPLALVVTACAVFIVWMHWSTRSLRAVVARA